MINKKDLKRIKQENPELYDSIYFNIAVILKKYSKQGYNYYKAFLMSNFEDNDLNSKIKKILYKLYLKSLSRNDLNQLNFANKNINKLIKDLEFEFLLVFTETGAFNIPLMQENKDVFDSAEKIILRDKSGFYSPIAIIQDRINERKAEFETLNSYLINKENIMNGNRKICSFVFTKRELLFIANYLGYGSVRDEILETQERENNKSLIKK